MRQEGRDAVRRQLPEELWPVLDQLVEEYRFYALKFHGRPFVSFKVLAALIEDGWRPSKRRTSKDQMTKARAAAQIRRTS